MSQTVVENETLNENVYAETDQGTAQKSPDLDAPIFDYSSVIFDPNVVKDCQI